MTPQSVDLGRFFSLDSLGRPTRPAHTVSLFPLSYPAFILNLAWARFSFTSSLMSVTNSYSSLTHSFTEL